jgi:hypothetical protein
MGSGQLSRNWVGIRDPGLCASCRARVERARDALDVIDAHVVNRYTVGDLNPIPHSPPAISSVSRGLRIAFDLRVRGRADRI